LQGRRTRGQTGERREEMTSREKDIRLVRNQKKRVKKC